MPRTHQVLHVGHHIFFVEKLRRSLMRSGRGVRRFLFILFLRVTGIGFRTRRIRFNRWTLVRLMWPSGEWMVGCSPSIVADAI